MKTYPKTIALITAELHKVVTVAYWNTNLMSQYQNTTLKWNRFIKDKLKATNTDRSVSYYFMLYGGCLYKNVTVDNKW